MAQRSDGGQGLSLRKPFHAGGYAALLLDRFRRHCRLAARSGQYQHRRLVRPRRRAAFGEGVGVQQLSFRDGPKDQARNLASVPNPKFAISAATTGANFGFERTLEKYDSSVVLVQKFS